MLDLLMNGFQMLAAFCDETRAIWKLIGTVVLWIQIAVPVLIILLGTIDLGKAVISGDEKKTKEAQQAFLRRLIYGLAVFLVVFVVRAVFGAVADNGARTSGTCWSCVANAGKC